MRRIIAALRIFFALALPYFRSEDRVAGRALAAGIVILEFALVYVAVVVNQWHGRFFNALEARDWDGVQAELLIFGLILIATCATGYAQYWLGQHFQIRWRRWLTGHFVDSWMAEGRHYRIRFVDDQIDNIHLRIANDVSVFIQKTHELGSGIIGVVITLASFAYILWGISATTPMPLFGADLSFPGYLILIAFVYAVAGTLLAHVIGYRLVGLNFNQQRREADLRFATARVTDHSEQVAMLRAEPVERAEIKRRFDSLVVNWVRLVMVNSNLTAFTYGYSQISAVFPMLVVAPAYLSGAIPLGVLMQAAQAFQRVEGGFSYMINAYGRIAEWKAAMDRLWQLQRGLERVDGAQDAEAIRVARGPGDDVAIEGLTLRAPGGATVADVPDMRAKAGDRILVDGPSGSGKSTLFRTMSGLWPFGEGLVALPANPRLLTLPSRPYFPLGTLRQALALPELVQDVDEAAMLRAMDTVGLGHLAGRLDDEAEWSSTLAGGEQQRIGFARVLIYRPNVLLIDDAVSVLTDEEAAELYGIVARQLPDLIVFSIGRAETLAALHGAQLSLEARAPASNPKITEATTI